MHPLLLQISIEPSSDTAHPQRAPLAVLSIHLPTAVLPSMAEAGVDSVTPITATIAKVITAARDVVGANIVFPSHFDRLDDVVL
jgi:hypothetical protein